MATERGGRQNGRQGRKHLGIAGGLADVRANAGPQNPLALAWPVGGRACLGLGQYRQAGSG